MDSAANAPAASTASTHTRRIRRLCAWIGGRRFSAAIDAQSSELQQDSESRTCFPHAGAAKRFASLIDKNLKAERLDLDDVAEEMRGQTIDSLNEVKWWVLESSRSMSFITQP